MLLTPRNLNALAKAAGVDVATVLRVIFTDDAVDPRDVARVNDAWDVVEGRAAIALHRSDWN
jgi:DNA-binding LacI/PurR family transcriptional regulator